MLQTAARETHRCRISRTSVQDTYVFHTLRLYPEVSIRFSSWGAYTHGLFLQFLREDGVTRTPSHQGCAFYFSSHNERRVRRITTPRSGDGPGMLAQHLNKTFSLSNLPLRQPCAFLRTLAILTLSQGKNSPFKLLCRVTSLVPRLLASPYFLVIAGQRTLEAYMLLFL